jgi:hypothetical protein
MEEEDLVDYSHNPLDDLGDDAIFFLPKILLVTKTT